MSKLDEILASIQRLAEPNGLITSDLEWSKQQIKELYLRLIDTCHEYTPTDDLNIVYISPHQLRKKVEEL